MSRQAVVEFEIGLVQIRVELKWSSLESQTEVLPTNLVKYSGYLYEMPTLFTSTSTRGRSSTTRLMSV